MICAYRAHQIAIATLLKNALTTREPFSY